MPPNSVNGLHKRPNAEPSPMTSWGRCRDLTMATLTSRKLRNDEGEGKVQTTNARLSDGRR